SGGVGFFFATGPLDAFGGIGGYPAAGLETAGVTGPAAVNGSLAAGQVLWVAVAPPKPFPWASSLRDRVVWHWSKENGYPTDAEIEAWSRCGNILLQQSEVMLWKDWNFRFVPRNGAAEFERVVNTCRRFGMRNMVYTSPFYFLPGTGREGQAMNSFEDFHGFSPGDGRGLNWPGFVREIRRVRRDYRPAGLYFDGIYNNVVRTYLVARHAREIVGDDGLLEYHATLNQGHCQHTPPGGGLFLPQIDAYFNFVLRGEGQHVDYANDDFLRYSVSNYNLGNAIGVLCNNYNHRFDAPFLERLLDCNVRLHLLTTWMDDERKELLEQHYWPNLNESLRARIEAASAKRATARAGCAAPG
ncbi:hypothetical protein HQ590_12830, partial [bacterium]|nr:hypothetical protein [bacterium]